MTNHIRRWSLSPKICSINNKDAPDEIIEDTVEVGIEEMVDVNDNNEDDEEHEDDDESKYLCSPCLEDINPTRIIRNPLNPSKEERERHNINHCPYRSWCNICIEGRGKEDPHYKNNNKEENKGIPIIALDYKSAGQEGKYDDKITIIVILSSYLPS